MTRQIKILLGLLFCFFIPAPGMVNCYEVKPVRFDWSGWTRCTGANRYVSQTIIGNFDSLVYVELFVGARGIGSCYRVEVWNGDKLVMWSSGVQKRSYSWVRFENWNRRFGFTRGKRYEFRFSRAGPDSIQFYYDAGNPYRYGTLLYSYAAESLDLCMRVYGVMKVIDSSWWGVLISAYDTVFAHKQNVHQRVRAAGVHLDRIDLLWNWVWPDSTAGFDFAQLDPAVFYSSKTMGCKVIGILDYSASWAGTRFDAPEFSPPRNLFLDVWHPSNYWARYVEGVVRHYYNDEKLIDVYEIWNEPNDTVRFWKTPQFHYHLSDNQQGLCSLYARLVEVALTVIDSITRGKAKVLIGSLVAMQPSIITRIPPDEMLSYCYRLIPEKSWWGVAFHPYQDQGFDFNLFEAQAESIRAVMRENGDYGELWITEVGLPCLQPNGECDIKEQANWVARVFAVARASQSLPGGGYDRICYYSFLTRGESVEGSYGLHTPSFEPKSGYYALAQTIRMLKGKRFNQRVILNDCPIDAVWVYEFEEPLSGKRLWIAWLNQITGRDTEKTVQIRLPVGCDTVELIPLAYNDTPAIEIVKAETDGGLNLNLGVRPVFIRERSAPKRPDLVVDDVQFIPDLPRVGEKLTVKVGLRNIGNRMYLGNSGCRIRFYLNNTLLTDTMLPATQLMLEPQKSATLIFEIPLIDAGYEEEGLFCVVVNPIDEFVELCRDNNQFYRLIKLIKP
ncbi:MAG: CARDB domain-containing protein [candidate division WOR-3 bacterium]|jgi:hypothetical protein|nr:hypothetical protein [candidate division WOR-3 bacterium]MDH7518807.1 CARDB domain-containing protein [bacterium]